MERTLFIFEGERVEKLYFQSLEKHFFSDQESRILVTYQNDLYRLYSQIAEDEDLDIFQLVKDLNPNAKADESIKNLRRDQIAQIYLFFDLEPCDNAFSGENLVAMLRRFNNETDQGKLFISYPMIEAIRDIADPNEFLDRTINLNDCRGSIYKRLSAERGSNIYQHALKLTKTNWQFLIEANLRKANKLVHNNAQLALLEDQSEIALNQLDGDNLCDPIYVLGAFPIFLADYFGLSVLDKDI